MAAGLRLTETGEGLVLAGAGLRLACRVVLSQRRSLVLRLDPEAGLEVRAPLGAGRARVERLLAEREAWILATLARWRELGLPRPPRRFAPGEELLHLGRTCRLELAAANGRARVELIGDRLIAHLPAGLAEGPRAALTRRLVCAWCRQRAQAELTPLVARHAAALGLAPPKLIIADQKARWAVAARPGCCA
ncbi:MAG: YgjP-like metallopeptidase domain-containing protein [Pseudomonadota bacterium]